MLKTDKPLSLCAIWIVASMRITIVSPRSRSATRDGGIRPCRASINPHTCRRVRVLTVVDLADGAVIRVADEHGVEGPRPLVADGAVVGFLLGSSAW